MSVTNSQGAGIKKIVIVDGHALAFRSYFAITSLTNSRGESLNAVFGFLKTITRLLKDEGHCILVTFDIGRTFRHDQYEGYKAGRAEMPQDLPGQIKRIKQVLDLMGIKRFEVEGYEADDIIGTLSKKAEKEGYIVHILTSDRDSYQLINKNVQVIRSDWSLMTEEGVKEKYGVTVDQWVDFRAMIGDPSDNIPGAKGIGEKTAAKLLQEHQTLDNILAAAKEGTLKPPKVAEKILASYDDVLFSRELSRMVIDLDIGLDFSEAHQRSMQDDDLRELLNELEFRSILKELGVGSQVAAKVATEWQDAPADAVWAFGVSKLHDLTADLKAVAYATEEAAYIAMPPSFEVLKGLQDVRAANAKELTTLATLNGVTVDPGDDPLLMAYVLDPNFTSPGDVAQRYLHLEWPDDVAQQASITRKMLDELPKLFNAEQKALYEDLEKPLMCVLAKMELKGVKLDVPFLKGLSESVGQQLRNLEQSIYGFAGREFNVNSRDQLETILYDELQLASGKKTKLTGKRSTAASVLEELREEHPIVGRLLEYREMAKLKGTYLDPLPSLVHPKTGRLHTTFAQTVAATGRLSSLNPNLQNIPVRSDLGREIRKGFIAEPGNVVMTADYSQIELRILAHISGDPSMIDAYLHDADIHRRTAAQIYNIHEEFVTPMQRRAAKTINFGVLYGMSAHRLTNELGISYAEANTFIQRYFNIYPKIREYIESTLEFCRTHGYVQTLLGRRRYIPEIHTKNKVAREAAERVAYNMPIQGTAADIIKKAMLALDSSLEGTGASLTLQVHDELVLEVPEDRVEEVSKILKSCMEGAFELKVPLTVEVGTGKSWYDAK
ncbi:DNA polymerase I [Deinococcus cellulosilyticus]|uniref:DNA polymerase I n=1 Tax=Deinococcus cellulosilyticus (strain DSM 18568 / NBRC 106333 / KACC 11606 / 5516J-15) TaxID=1223518 RepID=A0A511NBV1_DEIC1|nr:DNA polymerase I [Deinococcus cellulosilyticus]GEM50077.1 DNA polymerase I, thermostable [Deinococcus cellulosilyticus NBRC 106333 = KACC 11606]